MADVEYRNIEWAPGYRVGADGTVWSCRDRSGRPAGDWKRLSIYRRPYGCRYCVVCLRPVPSGQVVQRYIHRLVLEAFVGPAPAAGMVGCHNNGDTSDNRRENLRWDSCKGNMADQLAHGTRRVGERCPQAKLRTQDVREIRRLCGGGANQYDVGEQFGVSQSQVSAIVLHKRWKLAA